MSYSREYSALANSSRIFEAGLKNLNQKLVSDLNEACLIGEDLYQDILSPRSMLTVEGKVWEMMNVVKELVKLHRKNFFKFMDILRQNCGDLADELQQEYDRLGTGSAVTGPESCQTSRDETKISDNFSSYLSFLPVDVHFYMEREVTDMDFDEIAEAMVEWEWKLAAYMKLTVVDIADIKDIYSNRPALQRIEALRRWKSRHGFHATYGNLLHLFVDAKHMACAEALCEVLKKKSNLSLEQPSKELKGLSVLPLEQYEMKFEDLFTIKGKVLKKAVVKAVESIAVELGKLQIGTSIDSEDYRPVITITYETSHSETKFTPRLKKQIVDAIVDSTNYKEMFEVEHDPRWLKFDIDDTADLRNLYPCGN